MNLAISGSGGAAEPACSRNEMHLAIPGMRVVDYHTASLAPAQFRPVPWTQFILVHSEPWATADAFASPDLANIAGQTSDHFDVSEAKAATAALCSPDAANFSPVEPNVGRCAMLGGNPRCLDIVTQDGDIFQRPDG
jgi:hypothetical protein